MKAPPRDARHRVIDIHSHVQSDDVAKLTRGVSMRFAEPFVRYAGVSNSHNRELMAAIRSKFVNPSERIADMDRMGIDVQAIAVAPPHYFYWADPVLGAQVARMTNDRIAAIVAEHPSRFVGLGTVPLQDVDAALRELDRVTSELGFPGLEICTQVNGADLDAPRFRPFFEEVARRDLLLLVHPNGTTQGERLADHYLINLIGMPLDSTIFLARMIFSGVLQALPALKLCVVHGGGYAASYPDRFDHAWRVRPECSGIPSPPSAYLERLYFDTMVYDVAGLAALVARYGADHVVLGTDYPYDMAEPDPVGLVERLGLPDDERRLVLGDTAARLLGLRTTESGELRWASSR